ncbi:MAG: DUF4139 domain-containing protein, partial [Bacteroidota bacterium]
MMKKLIMIALPVLFSVCLFGSRDTVKVNSTISEVTIYLNGGEITRKAEANLAAGEQTIVLPGLSSLLHDQNIRISVPDGITLLSVSTRYAKTGLSPADEKIMKGMNDSIENMNNAIALLKNEKNAFLTEKDLMDKNSNIKSEQSGVSIDELKKAADFYRLRIKDINDNIFRIDQQAEKLNKELLKIYNRKNQLLTEKNKGTREIIADVKAAAAGKYPFEIKYIVNETSWLPTYDIKAVEIGKDIEFVYNAKVFNNTGVDWKNIKIKLSTADPTQTASKPSLSTWGLNYQSGQSYEGYVQNSNVGEFRGDMNGIYADPVGGNALMTNVAVSELSTEFEIKDPYSIPSDGKVYFIEVNKFTLPATYSYCAVPKMDRDAFLLARISGWEDLDIIDGEANVYFGNTYIGQSFINTRYVEDTLDLSLGRDKKILVTRSKLKDFSSKKVIGLNRKENFSYELIVKNNRKVPVKIEIIDQVPVSQEGDITVTVEEISGATLDDMSGKLTWEFELQPGESQKMTLSFSVKYPKNRTVTTRKYRSMSA